MTKRNFKSKNNLLQSLLIVLSFILIVSAMIGVYALFKENENSSSNDYLVVSYYVRDDLYKKQFYQKGETINLLDTEKYVWEFEDNTVVDNNYVITENVSFYTRPFNVSFIVDGVKLDENKVLYCGEILGELPVPTRDDYTFAGWYTADGVLFTSTSSMVLKDVTLYAHWTSPLYNVTCEYDVNTQSYMVTGTEDADATVITIPSTYDDGVNGVAFVSAIGDYAFNDNRVITQVVFPDSVTSIGYGAFDTCTSLNNIVLPDSLTFLGDRAFNSCTSLASINIPQGITRFGEMLFTSCAFTSFVIPSQITSIGENAFKHCINMQTLEFEEGSQLQSIGYCAFMECIALTDVTLPNGLKTIDAGAFYTCTGLTNVIIPETVTLIKGMAFYGCSNLTQMTVLAPVPPELEKTNAISIATTTIYIVVDLNVYANASLWSEFTNTFVKV